MCCKENRENLRDSVEDDVAVNVLKTGGPCRSRGCGDTGVKIRRVSFTRCYQPRTVLPGRRRVLDRMSLVCVLVLRVRVRYRLFTAHMDVVSG